MQVLLSGDFYKFFFDEFSDAVLIIEPNNWKIISANNTAKTILGISQEELDQLSFPQFKRLIKLMKKENSSTIFAEISFDSKEYGEMLLEVFAKKITINEQEFIIATCKSASDPYQMSDKLVQTDKLVLLGQLSASLVHEIRNPLAAVNLNLQLLQRAISDKNLLTYVNTALQGVERISKIIEVTLSFSRISTPRLEKIFVNSIILMTIELINYLLKKKEIEINIDFQNDLPPIYADAKQIQQILINLLTNAIDSIDGKGKISIRTFIDYLEGDVNKYVCIQIEDTGVGIPKEDLGKIFNPFFTKKPHGTGLGLPITQRLLYQYKGSIEVESEVEKGTRITIKFPAEVN
ncbi:MAG: two-component system sensor histidine kinase NtrB [Candidatus Kapaibacteriales bacterium]